MDKLPLTPRVIEYLRTLGNPYAKEQMFDVVAEAEGKASRSSTTPVNQLGRPAAPQPAKGWFDQPSGNPYARLEDEPTTPAALSKAEYRARCRRIFRQYIPAIEQGRLRTHHRDFITRNESRSPTDRLRIVMALEKYDLSDVPGLTAQFNRERDPFTEAKLQEIERQLDDVK